MLVASQKRTLGRRHTFDRQEPDDAVRASAGVHPTRSSRLLPTTPSFRGRPTSVVAKESSARSTPPIVARAFRDHRRSRMLGKIPVLHAAAVGETGWSLPRAPHNPQRRWPKESPQQGEKWVSKQSSWLTIVGAAAVRVEPRHERLLRRRLNQVDARRPIERCAGRYWFSIEPWYRVNY